MSELAANFFFSWRPLLHTRSRASVDSGTVVAREILLDLESRTWVVLCGPLGRVFRFDKFFVSGGGSNWTKVTSLKSYNAGLNFHQLVENADELTNPCC